MTDTEKDPLQLATEAMMEQAEYASREFQKQADEAERELSKLISPLWDTAAEGSRDDGPSNSNH